MDWGQLPQGWMGQVELDWLHATAQRLVPGSIWVEVGTWKGRSLVPVAEGLPSGCHLVAVDHLLGCPQVPNNEATVEVGQRGRDAIRAELLHTVDLIRARRSDIEVTLLEEESGTAALQVADGSVGVVFLDGDHTREGVARDLRWWGPKVGRGLICGHDAPQESVVGPVEERWPGRLELPTRLVWAVALGGCDVWTGQLGGY